MKKKLLILLGVLIGVFIILIGIFTKKDANDEVYETLAYIKGLKNYVAEFSMTIFNDKQERDYDIKEAFDKTKGTYMKIDEAREVWYLKEGVVVKDHENNRIYEPDKIDDNILQYICAHQYIKKLYTNEEVKYEYREENKSEQLVISFEIYDENANFKNAELFIDKATGKPSGLEIYNERNDKVIAIRYKNFKGDYKEIQEIFDVDRDTKE